MVTLHSTVATIQYACPKNQYDLSLFPDTDISELQAVPGHKLSKLGKLVFQKSKQEKQIYNLKHCSILHGILLCT